MSSSFHPFLGHTCVGYSPVAKCSHNIVYNQNGRISVNVTTIGYNAIYNVRFACTSGSKNVSALDYNSTITFNNTIINGTMLKGFPVMVNVTCYEDGLPISKSSVSNGDLSFFGALYANYTLSPNGQPNYEEIGRISLAIRNVG